ncbi:MAG TPA: CheR family methyltransferase [Chryseosolibacter sp.]|nr:CheR family methyltransferase [Chryseosolibacter sp.]
MNDADPTLFLRMDDESFDRLSMYVTREYGIKLPANKKPMLESRLNKKVKSLGMENYRQFLEYIFSDEGRHRELVNVIDLITTNKTDFFREPAHFQYLQQSFLPDYLKDYGYRSLNVWSAGCSTGEEPYTLLMVFEEFKKHQPFFTYSLMASDISTRVIQASYNGIYHKDRIAEIPPDMKRTYFLRSKRIDDNLVRVKPEFRKNITYRRINLMDNAYGIQNASLDIIFCRNVLIYFDKPTQEKVIRKFAACLRPGGLLFLGHSESLMGMNVTMKQLRPTVYQQLQ